MDIMLTTGLWLKVCVAMAECLALQLHILEVLGSNTILETGSPERLFMVFISSAKAYSRRVP
jgi:hypothetical protein